MYKTWHCFQSVLTKKWCPAVINFIKKIRSLNSKKLVHLLINEKNNWNLWNDLAFWTNDYKRLWNWDQNGRNWWANCGNESIDENQSKDVNLHSHLTPFYHETVPKSLTILHFFYKMVKLFRTIVLKIGQVIPSDQRTDIRGPEHFRWSWNCRGPKIK